MKAKELIDYMINHYLPYSTDCYNPNVHVVYERLDNGNTKYIHCMTESAIAIASLSDCKCFVKYNGDMDKYNTDKTVFGITVRFILYTGFYEGYKTLEVESVITYDYLRNIPYEDRNHICNCFINDFEINIFNA